MRKQIVVGLLGAAVVAGGGHFALLSPQSAKNAELRDLADIIEVQNTQSLARIPALRAELDNITGQLDTLRAVAAQVPAEMNLPGLYAELATAASQAGIPGAVSDVSVTTPVLVTPAEPSAQQAPAEEDPTGEPGADPQPAPQASAPSSQLIASFNVTMTVKGDDRQTLAFLRALKAQKRISVVSSTNLSVDEKGQAQMQITAKYFMQEVNVESLVLQIEALREAAAGIPAQTPAQPTDPAVLDPNQGEVPASGDGLEPTAGDEQVEAPAMQDPTQP